MARFGHIPSPFTWRCETEGVEHATVAGAQGSIAVAVGRLDFVARGAAFRESPSIACPDVMRVMPDGVHTVDRHYGEVDGTWATTVELGLGYSPDVLPFARAELGAGWIAGANAPYGTAALGVRFGERIRVGADLGLHYAATEFIRYRETWQDFERVSQTHAGQGRTWAAGPVFSAGAELRLR